MSELRRLLAPVATTPARQVLAASELIAALEACGLRGRGGAGFPVARKVRAAAQARGRRVVVVNAAEGEPASRKDAALLAHDPHLVLDGAQALARTIDADEVVVAAHRPEPLARALRDRSREIRTRVLVLAPGYVASEASAVVSTATGGPGRPLTRRRPLAEGGPGGRAWLVQNAETVACAGLLVRHGVGWYRVTGTPEEAGTLLLTVAGGVADPRVVEVPVGTSVRSVLQCAGGLAAPAQAVLVGGYAGRWLAAPDCFDVPVSVAGLRAAGGTLGAGLVLVLPSSACGLAVTADVVRYLAGQSARQCGPCLNGLPAMSRALDLIAAGSASPRTLDDLARWCGQLPGRGGCSHPDGTVALVRSALQVFEPDVRAHLSGGCGRPSMDVGVPR